MELQKELLQLIAKIEGLKHVYQPNWLVASIRMRELTLLADAIQSLVKEKK